MGHEQKGKEKGREKEKKIYRFALAGNPNVGKSTVFNYLTGLRHHTGNWPGKTVECLGGKGKKYGGSYTLEDLPGCYSLSPRSPEEETARNFICSGKADAIIIIADASCLERNLYLVLMTLEFTDHVVLGVNMLDEAAKRNIKVDIQILERELGIPVVGIIARKGKGLKKLIESAIEVSSGKSSVRCPDITPEQSEDEKSAQRAEKAKTITSKAVMKNGDSISRERRIDKILTGRALAFPAMLLLLALIFYITAIGANYPSLLLSRLFSRLGKSIEYALASVSSPHWLTSMLVDGMYNSLAWVVSVMLPPMAIFFPLFTLLEDLGYLPRIAYNLDRAFYKCTACGKQAITMCMGLGCNAVGVTGCRIIDSPRERLIAILTNSMMPCNGRFPSIIAITAMFSVFEGGIISSSISLVAVIVICVTATLAVSKLLSGTILKGMPSSFTLELPPYRKPVVMKIIIHSIFDRTIFVLGRAVAVAAPAGAVIWLCANADISGVTLLSRITAFFDPFAKIFGLDGVIMTAFILGLPANEIVLPIIFMTYTSHGGLVQLTSFDELKALLVANGWTGITPVCVLIFILFHWPCSTTLLTVKRETKSIKWTLFSAAIPTCLGLVCCFIINSVYTLVTALL